jgi:hypothetical protein
VTAWGPHRWEAEEGLAVRALGFWAQRSTPEADLRVSPSLGAVGSTLPLAGGAEKY